MGLRGGVDPRDHGGSGGEGQLVRRVHGHAGIRAKPVLAGKEAAVVSSATSIMRKGETKSATQLDALGVPRVQGNAQLMEPQDSVLEELEQDFEENYVYEMEDEEEVEVGRGCWFFGCRS